MENAGSRTQDIRDSVKWIGTTAIGIATAIAGTTVVARIGASPQDNLPIAIALTIAALVSIVGAASICAWAVTAPDPKLHKLLPALGTADLVPEPKSRSSRQLASELDQIGPVATFKYSDLSEVSAQLKELQASRANALFNSLKPGEASAGWRSKLAEFDRALETTYGELSEIASDVRLVRTERRARVAIPLVSALSLIAIVAMVPFILVSKAAPEAASIVKPVEVEYRFLIAPAVANSPDGCTPTWSGTALAVGGTWAQPLLLFEATPSTSLCSSSVRWQWSSSSNAQIVISPR